MKKAKMRKFKIYQEDAKQRQVDTGLELHEDFRNRSLYGGDGAILDGCQYSDVQHKSNPVPCRSVIQGNEVPRPSTPVDSTLQPFAAVDPGLGVNELAKNISGNQCLRYFFTIFNGYLQNGANTEKPDSAEIICTRRDPVGGDHVENRLELPSAWVKDMCKNARVSCERSD